MYSDMNSFQLWKESLFGIFVMTPKKQADLFNPMIQENLFGMSALWLCCSFLQYWILKPLV